MTDIVYIQKTEHYSNFLQVSFSLKNNFLKFSSIPLVISFNIKLTEIWIYVTHLNSTLPY